MRVSPVGFAFDSLENTLAHARRSAEVFGVEGIGGGGRKTHFSKRCNGEFAGVGADPTAPVHQRPGGARVGSGLAQIKVVTGRFRSNRRINIS